MTKCNFEVTPETKSKFRKIEYNRMLMSDYRSKETTKDRRKKTRTKKNKLADGFVRSEGVHYSSGAFHIVDRWPSGLRCRTRDPTVVSSNPALGHQC